MYASQTKRLCVREDPTEDTRAQHHSTSASSADNDNPTATTELQQEQATSQQSCLAPASGGVNTRRTSKASSAGGSASAGSGRDCCNSNTTSNTNFSTMTASATGAITGSENDLSVKNPGGTTSQTAPSIHPNYRDQTQRVQIQRESEPAVAASGNIDMDSHNNAPGADSEQQLIDRLANETLKETRLELILSIRNLITACNKRKGSVVKNPNFAKIIRIIDEEGQQTGPEVKVQLALLLCSLAKGGEQNVKVLNDSFVDDKIFNLILSSQDDSLIEACLRCLRAIMSWPRVSRHNLLYDNLHSSGQLQQGAAGAAAAEANSSNNNGPARMIDYARTSKSHIVQECVANIFDATCNRPKDQILLFNSGALPCILQMLESKSHRVTLAALEWLSTICTTNPKVSLQASLSCCPSGKSLLDRLVELMRKDECIELQLSAAKCFTRIYKALEPNYLENDPRVVAHVLPALVRMVHKDKSAQIRAEAASTIAILIEGDPKLQNIASICDNLIDSLAHVLEFESTLMSDIRNYSSQLLQDHCTDDKSLGGLWRTSAAPAADDESRSPQLLDLSNNCKPAGRSVDLMADSKYPEAIREMERSAFQALAALAANQETIRKKIFESCSVMQHLVRGLSDSDPRTLKSVLICLLSLSRSVQELRTNFSDGALYSGLKNLLLTSSQDILNLVLMILCNISMVFSPGKQHFLDPATIGIVCNLIKGSDPALKLSGMWILMNMVYMLENADLKFQILRTLKIEQVTNILDRETDEQLLLKTLGFIRNLLSNRPHIDQIMSCHGEPLMRSLVRLLDRCHAPRIREQAICVLTNIADGLGSKALIMSNQAIMTHLTQTIYDEAAGDSRIAAICCITNLAHKDQEGFHARQSDMKKCGILEKLKLLTTSDDISLQSRARTAYNQFSQGIGDKYVS